MKDAGHVDDSPYPSGKPAVKPRFGPGLQVGRINWVVITVCLIFAYLYYVDIALIIVPWLSYSVPGVMNTLILTYETGVSLFCYLFCVLMDPGSVPVGWKPDEEQLTVTELKRKGGTYRICSKCNAYKPPRTHHCRVCQRCVTKMDHHCPWTNNCIGHANYKAFLVFLIYVCAALLHTVGLICAHALHAIQVSQQQRILRTGPRATAVRLDDGWASVWLLAVAQALAFAIALPLGIGLIMLLGWHLHLLAVNKTTIEYQEGVRAAVQSDAYASTFDHPYNLGLCNNLHEVLGDNAAAWCLPPCHETPGGTKYPTVWDDQFLGLEPLRT